MSTQEVANQWASLCRAGKYDQAQAELYADHCVSLEMEGAQGLPQRVEGMEAIKAKGAQWHQMIQEVHHDEIGDPIVAGDFFSATLKTDLTMKGQPRRVNEEVGLFRVENGKIVSEQFFYSLG